ncbi:MAG: DUF5615 family PIN-like protein [Saprospiraceae bacterium]
MNFIADEGVDGSLVKLLRQAEHDVFYFAENERSTDDDLILELANKENRILLTRDKDFGELVYRLQQVHTGIILIRLEELKSTTRSQIVFDFIQQNLDQLSEHFIVIQAGGARIRSL